MSRRNKNNGGDHGGGGEERWLLPYADMITLLLGLFIVLFAMSSIDSKQYDEVRRSLSETFRGSVLEESGGVLPGSSGVLDPAAPANTNDARITSLAQAAKASKAQFDKKAEQIEKSLKQSSLGNDVKVTRNERGIVVRLAGDALFDTGSAALKPNVLTALTKLERELEAFNRPIEIGGHTDGQPYPGYHHGNWGLSADRSLAVVTFFLQKGYPSKLIKPTFYADTKPVKTPPKGNPSAGVAANRRIEITILEPGSDDPTPTELALDSIAKPVTGAKAKAANPRVELARPAEADIESQVNASIVAELADTSRGVAK